MLVRMVAAVAAAISSVVHLWLWFDGVKDQGEVGVMFMINAVAGVVIAVLLIGWEHWLPPFLVAGFGASTLGAFFISATVGLFGIEAGWSWYAWVAAVSEVVCIAAGLWSLWTEGWITKLTSRSQPQDGVSV
jgi:hypothetical protein